MIIWEKKYYVCIMNLFQFFYKLIILDYKIFPIHMLKNKIIPHYFHSSLTRNYIAGLWNLPLLLLPITLPKKC